MRSLSPSVLSLLFLTCLSCGAPPPDPADLILYKATVWTGDDTKPRASAVAIRGNEIVAVGDDRDVLRFQGDTTRTIDLGGAFLTPGFNDNHVHFASAARFLEFNIMRTGSQEEFLERVRETVSELSPGEWILGGFWGAYDQWVEGSSGSASREPFVPDMSLVEELTADHPMLIRKFDSSQFAANRAALEAVRVNPHRPRARKVRFLRDSAGQYTGVMTGEGVWPLFENAVPTGFSHERRVNQTRRALREIRRHGVTNVSDMSDQEQLQIYQDLREAGDLTVRVHYRYPLDESPRLAREGIKVGTGDAWIRLGSLKGHIDGIMGTSSARFLEPYSNDPQNRGRWRRLMVDDNGEFVEGQFLKHMLDADAAGLQLTGHAIGDEANSLLLDYLEELNKQNGTRDRRFRLVHAQVIADKDFKRLGELGIVAEVQPFHLSDDMRWMEERIGSERCRGAYAFRRIQESGAVLSFGTDWPGTSAAEYPIDPMLGLYAAVTRQTTSGTPTDGWFPDEKIGIEEALRAYTYNTAYANFEEDRKGSIEVGKLADLTVLSRNLLEASPKEILNTEALFTIVDGRIVYEAGKPE